MESLIQQRMAIDRQRNFGTTQLIFGIVFAVISIGELLTSGAMVWPGYLSLLLGIFWLISGLRTRIRAESSRRAFEAEHGTDAGRQ